jgi:hypothetical protein
MPKWTVTLLAACAIVGVGSAWAASLTPGLVDGLRHGGYVLVIRHASSPTNPPDKSVADTENVTLERQLDEKGRMAAEAMGRAFKYMNIPVGEVFSSPTYRARETIRLAGFGVPETVPDLGDQGHSMARLNGSGPSAWLEAQVAKMSNGFRTGPLIGLQKGPPWTTGFGGSAVGAGWGCGDGASAGWGVIVLSAL